MKSPRATEVEVEEDDMVRGDGEEEEGKSRQNPRRNAFGSTGTDIPQQIHRRSDMCQSSVDSDIPSLEAVGKHCGCEPSLVKWREPKLMSSPRSLLSPGFQHPAAPSSAT